MAEKRRSGGRWQAKLLIGIPALVALGIFVTSVVVRSLRDFRATQHYSIEYRAATGWEKTRVTSVPEFCQIEIGTAYPWIWLNACKTSSEEIVPLSREDEIDWVSRIPESKAMVHGRLHDVPAKESDYYDEKARRFVAIRFPDGNGGLKSKWFKLLIDGTIVEVH